MVNTAGDHVIVHHKSNSTYIRQYVHRTANRKIHQRFPTYIRAPIIQIRELLCDHSVTSTRRSFDNCRLTR